MRKLFRKVHAWDSGRRLWQRFELYRWRARGRPGTPPPRFKQQLVRAYARRFECETFVETGTFFGDMLDANRKVFRQLHSIELDPRWVRRARARFAHNEKVHILQGDSGEVLPDLLRRVEQKTLFWLDAHQMIGGVRGSQTTPIIRELEAIFSSDLEDSVLLIDDARLFTGGDYPSLEEVEALLHRRYPEWVLETTDDILRGHRRPVDSHWLGESGGSKTPGSSISTYTGPVRRLSMR